MKIKIKNFNGELPDYLTVGKVYEIYNKIADIGGYIVNDFDEVRYIVFSNSNVLCGGQWEVVSE